MTVKSRQNFTGVDIKTRKRVELAWFHGVGAEEETGYTWHGDGTFQAGGEPHPLDVVKALK